MAKATQTLDWCIVRLGEDHNWWVDEVSDPVRWDVDGLSIIDPRQVDHLVELVDPLRDYGFDQEVMERAFIAFRIEKDLGNDEKLFALPDLLDEENGPYADLLDHLTRCRVKMLNDLFEFESKLSVDEVEDEIREEQNTHFIEGKALHTFAELTAILDYMPAGYETDDEQPAKEVDEDEDDLPELDAEEEEKLKNDESLRWDEDEEGEDDESKEGEKKDDDEDGDDEEEDEDEEESDEDEDEKPRRSSRKR